MKANLILLALFLLCGQAYCQSKNSLSLVFGAGSNAIGSIGIGGAGYQGKGETIYGLNYSRNLTKSFSIETGLEYSVNNVLWDYEDAFDPSFTPQKGSIRMLSVPVYANFTFLKYLFANAGIIADFETNYHSYSITPNQSGIGLGAGIGGKYNFNSMTVFINPFLQWHAIVAAQNEGSGSLFDAGVKVGIGYRF
ncbi:MAG: hypothetical protein JWP37_1386 [Mucilaginibacter sp.]|nr:hypothetical protein [Mucilaginibacter sp.]